MKKPVVITGLALVSVIIILMLYVISSSGKLSFVHENRMNPSFKKVDTFTRPALFLTYDLHLRYMDVSRDSSFHLGPILDKDHIRHYSLAVRPDKSHFYIVLNSEVGLY